MGHCHISSLMKCFSFVTGLRKSDAPLIVFRANSIQSIMGSMTQRTAELILVRIHSVLLGPRKASCACWVAAAVFQVGCEMAVPFWGLRRETGSGQQPASPPAAVVLASISPCPERHAVWMRGGPEKRSLPWRRVCKSGIFISFVNNMETAYPFHRTAREMRLQHRTPNGECIQRSDLT